MWSVVAAVLGIAATGAAAARLRVTRPTWPPEAHWGLGLAGLVPAWLVNLVGLLGGGPVGAPALRFTFLVSVGLGLLGVILTDALLRHRFGDAGRHDRIAWALGLAALAPAWLVSLLARAWLRL